MQPTPVKPVQVETFFGPKSLESRLNEIATTPGNRWDLKFLTETLEYNGDSYYTAVFCWVPESNT